MPYFNGNLPTQPFPNYAYSFETFAGVTPNVGRTYLSPISASETIPRARPCNKGG
jgi:hypothetical protein